MSSWSSDSNRWEQLAAECDFRAGSLAPKVNNSPRTLRRKFKSWFGCPPRDYLNRRQILKAMELLLSELSVKEVAEKLGFTQAAHFCRKFKAQTGVTPKRFAAMPRER